MNAPFSNSAVVRPIVLGKSENDGMNRNRHYMLRHNVEICPFAPKIFRVWTKVTRTGLISSAMNIVLEVTLVLPTLVCWRQMSSCLASVLSQECIDAKEEYKEPCLRLSSPGEWARIQ